MDSIKISKEQGWTEFVVCNNCGVDNFYKIAEWLQSEFKIAFNNKLNDLETFYWDFIFDQCELTIHYNTFIGVSIFPTKLNRETKEESEMVQMLATKISNSSLFDTKST